MKAVEEKNRREMNFFSQGWGEDYRDLLESVAYRRRAGEIISDCMRDKIAYVHNELQMIFPRLVQRNKQSCTNIN